MNLVKNAGSGCVAVVLAAGNSRRMLIDDNETNKVFIMLEEKPILAHALLRFELCEQVDKIVVVARACDIVLVHDVVKEFGFHKVSDIVAGGETRQGSAMNGIKAANAKDILLIHDAARPFVSVDSLINLIQSAKKIGAATLAVRVKDTLKKVSEDNMVISTLLRQQLWHVQTPQGFWPDVIHRAHLHAQRYGVEATDDCALVESMGGNVEVVEGSYHNIKITTKEDLTFADVLCRLCGM